MKLGGAIAGTVNGENNMVDGSYRWDPQNFAGFYYDIKKDIGTETLMTTLTEGNKLCGDGPYGVAYTTTAQAKEFNYENWGNYIVIGFLSEMYFAGYIESYSEDSSPLFRESTDEYP